MSRGLMDGRDGLDVECVTETAREEEKERESV